VPGEPGIEARDRRGRAFEPSRKIGEPIDRAARHTRGDRPDRGRDECRQSLHCL
jgi:hypothetical protein